MAGQVIIEMGPCDAEGNLIAEQVRSEEETSGGVSTATTITTARDDCIVIHNNQAGVIWAAFGVSPTAAVGTTVCIPANTSRTFRATQGGLKVAVIDDS